MPKRRDRADMLSRVKTALREDGLEAALRVLNERAGLRFSAIFEFQTATLHNLVFVDGMDPTSRGMADLPVLASYCVFVRDSGATFRVDDALDDPRVAHHPKYKEIRSYCGVPLLDDQGRMYGTVCHFDTSAVPIDDSDVALLEELSPLLRVPGGVNRQE